MPPLSTLVFALALSAAPDALEKYRQQSLDLRISFLSGVEAYRGGDTVDLGYFGGGAEVALAQSHEAVDRAKTFRFLRIAGSSFLGVGLAALASNFVIAPVAPHALISRDSYVQPLLLSLLIPGVVVSLIGALMLGIAPQYLSDAVVAYNTELARRLEASH